MMKEGRKPEYLEKPPDGELHKCDYLITCKSYVTILKVCYYLINCKVKVATTLKGCYYLITCKSCYYLKCMFLPYYLQKLCYYLKSVLLPVKVVTTLKVCYYLITCKSCYYLKCMFLVPYYLQKLCYYLKSICFYLITCKSKVLVTACKSITHSSRICSNGHCEVGGSCTGSETETEVMAGAISTAASNNVTITQWRRLHPGTDGETFTQLLHSWF